MKGFNGTIFAYGQTSSGKTYTMEGEFSDSDKRGLIPRIAEYVFEATEASKNKCQITVSCCEIYLEKINDLLSEDKDKEFLKIFEDKKNIPWLKGVTKIQILNLNELVTIYQRIKRKQKVSVTDMNAHSSRSHTLFQIKVFQEDTETKKKIKGTLLLVDLAGSEMLHNIKTKNETVHINRSLSALTKCIYLLSMKKKCYIPYRESKLTRLLKESLGGNALTTIIVCVAPDSERETKSTLDFGCRAQLVKNEVSTNCKTMSDAESRLREIVLILESFVPKAQCELQKWRNGETVSPEEWFPLDDIRPLINIYQPGENVSNSSLSDSCTFDDTLAVIDIKHSTLLSDSQMELSLCDEEVNEKLESLNHNICELEKHVRKLTEENELLKGIKEVYQKELAIHPSSWEVLKFFINKQLTSLTDKKSLKQLRACSKDLLNKINQFRQDQKQPQSSEIVLQEEIEMQQIMKFPHPLPDIIVGMNQNCDE